MKKALFTIFMIGLVASCNSKSGDNSTSENIDNKEIKVENSSSKQEFKIITNTEISEHLAPKNNDTLYVTNFFATWCGPCIREIPHFKEVMQEMNGKPVKFTFVNLDEKDVWNTDVVDFAENFGIGSNIVLLDFDQLSSDFFEKNFSEWDGGSIPFTHIRKGNKVREIRGSISKSELENEIQQVH